MFTGLYTALITPFLPSKEIDTQTFIRLIKAQHDAGVDGIIIGGTTGESPTLTQKELEFLFCLAKENFSSGHILVGAGSNCTQKTIDNLSFVKGLGADGALVVTPYYNKPCQRGVIAHYEACNQIGLPLMQYHIPGRTHVTLSHDALLTILSLDCVMACKESSQNLQLTQRLSQGIEKPILCGDDALVLPYLEAGAKGAVSVLSNLFPKEWMRIVHNKDQATFKKMLPYLKLMELEVNPKMIKLLMSLQGKCHLSFRLPLVEPHQDSIEKATRCKTALHLCAD